MQLRKSNNTNILQKIKRSEEMQKQIFYKPKTGVCADFIPFYDKGTFKLFFLRDYRDREKHGEGTPWQLTMTKDLVNFTTEVEIISRGTKEEQDLYVFTGCVIRVEDKYHVFYTGHNPHLRKKGLPEQAVMHAISEDGENFTKVPEDTFFAPTDKYEIHDWRDPFVYFDEKSKSYKMLLATRSNTGPAIRRGCTTMCTSKDLRTWVVERDVLSPEAYFTHECPDYFEIGVWKYLIFSEFSDRCLTRYKMSRDGKKWLTPKNDSFDGRAYYAAKTASDGDKRYIFGWIPTKKETDHDSWNWGGDLAIHEVYQGKNGALFTKMPENILVSFKKELLTISRLEIGGLNKDEVYKIETGDHDSFMVEFDISLDRHVTGAGVLLNYDPIQDRGYTYSLNLHQKSFAFDVYPNQPWNLANFVNVNRPLLSKKTYHIQVLVQKNVAVAYLDNQFALSTRMYPLAENVNKLSLFAKNGQIEISNFVVRLR